MKAILILILTILTSSCGHHSTCKVEPDISISKTPDTLDDLDPKELKDHVKTGGSVNCTF